MIILPSAVSLITLLCLLSSCTQASFTAEEYWENFNIAFGNATIRSSFSTPKSLKIASESEALTLQLTQNICCLDYISGDALARQYRGPFDADYSLLVPFFVGDDPTDPDIQIIDDLEDYEVYLGVDKMCFYVMQTFDASRLQERAEIIAACKFQAPIPASLKLSRDIYDSIDSLSFSGYTSPMATNMSNTPDNLIVGFCNFTTANRGEYKEPLKKGSLTSLLEQLKSYNLEVLSSFYWSQTQPLDAAQYLSEKEQDRMNVWTDLTTILTNTIDTIPLDIDPTEVDPCLFRSLNYTIVDSDVQVPIKDYIDSFRTLDSQLTAACLAYISAVAAQEFNICSVQYGIKPDLLNYRSRAIMESPMAKQPVDSSKQMNPYSAAGLLGAGVLVGVGDTGLDQNSCYFLDSTGPVKAGTSGDPITDFKKRKVVQYTAFGDKSDYTEGHGTHVAGTVAGSNEMDLWTDGKYSGIAPDAKIVFMDQARGFGGLRVPSLKSLIRNAVDIGTKIFTFSWGNGYRGEQSYYGGDYDAFLYKNSDIVIFFAAGNSKENSIDMTLTQQATIKNAISVGATDSTSSDIGNLAYFSSNGPTYDGRIKPDICAPGYGLESASAGSTCGTVGKQGTSMASPSAAGAAALIHAYFKDEKFWKRGCNSEYKFCRTFTPSGALTKALILHSGEPMKKYFFTDNSNQNVILGAPPDTYQGYGRIQLANVLPLPSAGFDFDLFVSDSTIINAKNKFFLDVFVDSGKIPLKVTIAWYDPPNSGTPAKALLHNLDLEAKVKYI